MNFEMKIRNHCFYPSVNKTIPVRLYLFKEIGTYFRDTLNLRKKNCQFLEKRRAKQSKKPEEQTRIQILKNSEPQLLRLAMAEGIYKNLTKARLNICLCEV